MSVISIIILMVLLIGCSSGLSGDDAGSFPNDAAEATGNNGGETAGIPDAVRVDEEGNTKMLVVFYSYSHNTETVAKRIAYLTGADIYEIKTVKPYPDDPYETSDISKEERSSGKLPEIVDDCPDLLRYDIIFIGGPIWNANMSTPLKSYMEQMDFAGKRIVPFSTSMGSGQKGYLADFESSTKNPEEIGEYMDVQFPGNGQPDAFADEELDEKLAGWLGKYIGMAADNSSERIEKGTVLLNSGYEMPVLGLGTWTLTGDVARDSVYLALKEDYRLIDTARYYGNEEEVGEGLKAAIRDGIVTREEVFITTKIVPSGNRDYDALIDESLEKLDVGYIDLLLIHQSGAGEKELYSAMENAVKDGRVHSIGISNYYTKEAFDDITENAEIMPAVVQNENHIFYQNIQLQEYVAQYGTFMESWYPFGGRGHTSDSFNNPVITEIAGAHGKTSAQVILRWHLQAGYIVIPGSSNPDHIAENIDVFDFELTEDEMHQIEEINTGNRYESW